MKYEMKQVEVYCSDEGFVCIKQDLGDHRDHDQVVVLAPEQIDTLVEWLKRTKEEAMVERGENVPRDRAKRRWQR